MVRNKQIIRKRGGESLHTRYAHLSSLTDILSASEMTGSSSPGRSTPPSNEETASPTAVKEEQGKREKWGEWENKHNKIETTQEKMMTITKQAEREARERRTGSMTLRNKRVSAATGVAPTASSQAIVQPTTSSTAPSKANADCSDKQPTIPASRPCQKAAASTKSSSALPATSETDDASNTSDNDSETEMSDEEPSEPPSSIRQEDFTEMMRHTGYLRDTLRQMLAYWDDDIMLQTNSGWRDETKCHILCTLDDMEESLREMRREG